MDIRKRALGFFEEEIIPYLSGNEYSAKNLEQQAKTLCQINEEGKLNSIIELMNGLKPPTSKRNRQGYYLEFSLRLAIEFQKLLTKDVQRHYSVSEPLALRGHYL